MNTLIDRLRAKRQGALEDLIELVERASDEHRAFTPEEMGIYDVLTERVEQLNNLIEAEKGLTC